MRGAQLQKLTFADLAQLRRVTRDEFRNRFETVEREKRVNMPEEMMERLMDLRPP